MVSVSTLFGLTEWVMYGIEPSLSPDLVVSVCVSVPNYWHVIVCINHTCSKIPLSHKITCD